MVTLSCLSVIRSLLGEGWPIIFHVALVARVLRTRTLVTALAVGESYELIPGGTILRRRKLLFTHD